MRRVSDRQPLEIPSPPRAEILNPVVMATGLIGEIPILFWLLIFGAGKKESAPRAAEK
jgi:hypothetical protein